VTSKGGGVLGRSVWVMCRAAALCAVWGCSKVVCAVLRVLHLAPGRGEGVWGSTCCLGPAACCPSTVSLQATTLRLCRHSRPVWLLPEP
jgi:hypothetical protein